MNNTPEKIREALAFIPASIPRDEWARVGMAIKSEYPDSTGFELFDAWSQSDPDGYNPTDVRDTWKSVNASGGVGIGTVFYLAKANGYTPTPGAKVDPATAQRLAGERAARELLANKERAQRQQQAAQVAARRWQAATPATEHPYLSAKGVQAHGVKLEGEALLIPMRDTAGTLHSVQVIDPEGGKRFLPGGRVKGCYHAIGKPEGVLIVCEGYATGASIHEATGHAGAVAFNAGNLEAVAQALRQKYPDARLIVAADDDWRTDGNPGVTKATAAARAAGALLAVPRFPADRPDKATDFNDLHKLAGLEAVRACIDAAQPVASLALRDAYGGDSWPDPVPLPDALPRVAPFDAELLPEALRGWVADMAGGAVQASSAPPLRETDAEELAKGSGAEPQGPKLRPVSVFDVVAAPSPAPRFVWEGYMPRGVVSMLGAHGGTGKSTIALMLTVAAATGRPLFGVNTEPSRVLFLSLEDGEAIVRHRLAHICREWGIEPEELANLQVFDGTDDPELFVTTGGRDAGGTTGTYAELYELAKGYDLVIVDNASDAYGGDEIQRRQVRGFIRSLGRIARDNDAAALLLAHVDKNTSRAGKPEGGEGYSGSTAWHNSVRSRLFMTRRSECRLLLEHQKANFGKLREPINLFWPPDGLPQLDAAPTVGVAHITDRANTQALLRLIAEFTERGEYVSTAPTSRSHAAKLLAESPLKGVR